MESRAEIQDEHTSDGGWDLGKESQPHALFLRRRTVMNDNSPSPSVVLQVRHTPHVERMDKSLRRCPIDKNEGSPELPRMAVSATNTEHSITSVPLLLTFAYSYATTAP